MATYLQGIAPYIPQIQPFSPDFNFYSGVLEFKQKKTDENRKRLSNMYGSLLNAPMMREDNLESREQFFKAINRDIQKMATMDLSKESNIQAAMDVFSQLYDNEYIVKDMVWTKNYQSQLQRAEGFRNCVNEEKCGGKWWEGGERALQYKAEEFRNASRDQSLAFGNARYTPYQDVTKKAMALAKEAGLNISVDQLQGGYITTTKNGPMLVGPLQNLFMGSLGNDPMIADYYKTKAYVDRKDWVYSNQETYGSLEASENAYIAQMGAELNRMINGTKTQIEDKAETTKKVKEDIEKEIQKNGALPGSTIAQVYNDLTGQEASYRESQGVIQGAADNLETANTASNATYSAEYIDNAMASILLGQDINAAAETLAYKDYEFKMKEDPYSMEAYRQKNRIALEDLRHQNALERDYRKFEYDQYIEQLAAMGSGEYNNPTAVDVLGGVDAGSPNEMTYDQTMQGYSQFAEQREGLKNDLSASERDILNQVYSATSSAAEKGNTQAQADLIAMVDAMANAAMTPDQTLSGLGESDERAGMVEGGSTISASEAQAIKQQFADPNMTHAQKYALAKKYSANIASMRGSDVDEIYEGTIKHMYARKDGNEVLRPHLDNVWSQTAEQRRQIEAKYTMLDQMDGWYASESSGVVGASRSSAKYGDLWADAFESYIDDKGHTVTKNQFIESFTAKGYDREQAEAIWGGDRRLKFNEYYDEETGKIETSFWSGVANVIASGLDAVGTTVAGATGEISNFFEWLLPNMGPEEERGAEWGEGWGNTAYGWGNWDYDSPADVANWGGYGQESGGGYGDSPNVGEGYGISSIGNRGYNDDLAMGAPGIHDMWKRAFSEYAEPDGNRAWLGINGSGNEAVQGLRYDVVDPKYYRSQGTMGTMGFLKDALNSSSTIVDIGGPKNTVPSGSEEDGQEILNTLYRDMITLKKGDSRPLPQVTYQDIAGGNSDMTALNIKLNQSYINKYKGSKDSPGLLRPHMEKLMTEGMTVYLPKNETTNIFTQGSQKSHLEHLMGYKGEIAFDNHPQYTKDMKLVSDKETGGYYLEGEYMAGLDEQGTPIWQPYPQTYYPPNLELTNAVKGVDEIINEIAKQNKSIIRNFNLRNGTTNPADLLNQ
jgi:hypothetical protein